MGPLALDLPHACRTYKNLDPRPTRGPERGAGVVGFFHSCYGFELAQFREGHHMARSLIGCGLGLLMLVASTAHAAPFASNGTLAIGAERLFGVEYTSLTVSQPGGESTQSATSISLLGRISVFEAPLNVNSAIPRLSADYFLGPGISLGGSLMYQHLSFGTDNDDDDNDNGMNLILLAPRVGYGARLSDQFAIWPRLGLSYLHAWRSSTGRTMDANGNLVQVERSATSNQTFLSLDAMFVYTPVEHVGFSFGPAFDYLLGRSETTNGNDDTLPDNSMYGLGIHAGLLVWL